MGGSEHRNTAEKFTKYRNIAKKKKNRQVPQYYNTVSKLDVILKPLQRFGNVRFRQNKQNKEHLVACWLIINTEKSNDRKLEKARKRRIFYPVQNPKKPHPADLKNTAIPQFKIKIIEILQKKIIQHRNTANPNVPLSTMRFLLDILIWDGQTEATFLQHLQMY